MHHTERLFGLFFYAYSIFSIVTFWNAHNCDCFMPTTDSQVVTPPSKPCPEHRRIKNPFDYVSIAFSHEYLIGFPLVIYFILFWGFSQSVVCGKFTRSTDCPFRCSLFMHLLFFHMLIRFSVFFCILWSCVVSQKINKSANNFFFTI